MGNLHWHSTFLHDLPQQIDDFALFSFVLKIGGELIKSKILIKRKKELFLFSLVFPVQTFLFNCTLFIDEVELRRLNVHCDGRAYQMLFASLQVVWNLIYLLWCDFQPWSVKIFMLHSSRQLMVISKIPFIP